MHFGVITKVHDDKSGFVKSTTGARYRFYADNLWGFEQRPPQAGDGVAFESGSNGQVVKAVRRVQPQRVTVVSTLRWLPALVSSRGVATNRYAAAIYLPQGPVAGRSWKVGEIVLLRLNTKTGQPNAPVALEVRPLTGERAEELRRALGCDETTATTRQQELDEQLRTAGYLTAAELPEWTTRLQLRDAYTIQAPARTLEAEPIAALELRRQGYDTYVTISSLLRGLATDTGFGPANLSPPLLMQYIPLRLQVLGSIDTPEACREVQQLYQLTKQKIGVEPAVDWLAGLPMNADCQIELWVNELPVSAPTQPELVAQLLQYLEQDGQPASLAPLLNRCGRQQQLADICQSAMTQNAPESRVAAAQRLCMAINPAYQQQLVAAISELVPVGQQLQWWEQNLLSVVDARAAAVRLVGAAEAYWQAQLEKFCRLEEATMALLEAMTKIVTTSIGQTAALALLRFLAGHRSPARQPQSYYSLPQRWYGDYTYRNWAQDALNQLRPLSRKLPAAQQVRWWLLGVGLEPDEAVLQVRLPLLKGSNLARAWQLLSTDMLPGLVAAWRDWLAQEQPVAWVEEALKQLKSRQDTAAGYARDALYEVIRPQLPVATQIAWWEQSLIEEPAAELLGPWLVTAAATEASSVVKRLAPSSLPAVVPTLLARLPADGRLTEEVLRRIIRPDTLTVAGEQLRTSVLARILPELTREQQLSWWLADLLPAPPATLLVTEMANAASERQQTLLDKCPPALLLAYSALLQSPLLDDERRMGLIRACATKLNSFIPAHPEVQPALAALLASVPPAELLTWWSTGTPLVLDWALIEQGLADECRRTQVLDAAARDRLPELRAYLTTAPVSLLMPAVATLTNPRIMGKHGAADQIMALIELATRLCRADDLAQPALLTGLLQIQVRCHKPDLQAAYSAHAQQPAVEFASIAQAVTACLAPRLDPAGLLRFWQQQLLTAFPQVSPEEIACFVAQNRSGNYRELGIAAQLPLPVVEAWQRLGSLPNLSMHLLRQAVCDCIPAWSHRGLLRSLNPWLVEELSAEQLTELWLLGHPMAPPPDWEAFPFNVRLKTSVLYAQHKLLSELPPGFVPTEDETGEWLAAQYWEEAQQTEATELLQTLRAYHNLVLQTGPEAWDALEDALLLRCTAVVKVRLWLNCPDINRARTFNYYGFRRGFSRLRLAEQRTFLRVAQPYLKVSFARPLHLRRRYLVRRENCVAVYRVALAHGYCPQEGYLEVELADRMHTQPFAYAGAEPGWNEQFLREPWASYPVLVHIEETSHELLRIQGLEEALQRFPPGGPASAWVTFRPRRAAGEGDKAALAYPEDDVLQDELRDYLTQLTGQTTQTALVLEEARALRKSLLSGEVRSHSLVEAEDIEDESELNVTGLTWQPRQTMLYPVELDAEVVYVWASRFAQANRATYLFRVPVSERQLAMERLTTILQRVGNIRSALLAPGVVSHRLRCHLGYAGTIRGQRGKAQAFERWQARFTEALAAGPSLQHPYDPNSDWQVWELDEVVKWPGRAWQSSTSQSPPPPAAEPAASEVTLPVARATPAALTERAHQLLQHLQRLTDTFLVGYPV